MKRVVAVVAVSVSVSWVGSAGADPPRTCGRIAGQIVRVHQIPCRTGMRWTRDYLSHRAVPRGYTCARYRGPATNGIPWVCRNNRVTYREFWVVRPAG
jgi:hypothetical protein